MDELEKQFYADDLESQFNATDEALAQISDYTNSRGNNFAGGARNFAQSLSVGTADEIEAYARSNSHNIPELRNKLNNLTPEEKEYYRNNPRELAGIANSVNAQSYDKYLQNARESAKGFARANPEVALGLQIAGSLAPAFASFGATAPATGATLGANILSGMKTAGILGAAGGIASGEGLEDRLNKGLIGGGIGLGVGAAIPAGTYAGAAGLRGIRRFAGGFKPELGETAISDTILNKALLPTPQGKMDANTLFSAGIRGDKAIMNASNNLYNKIRGGNFSIVEATPNAPWTAETPHINKIQAALSSDSRKAARDIYANFDAATPTVTPDAGLAVNNLLKNNPKLYKLYQQELKENAPDWANIIPSSREGIKKMIGLLRSRIPQNGLTPEQAIRYRSIIRGLDDLQKLGDTLYPGSKLVNTQYAAAENVVQKPFEKEAKSRIAQIASGVPAISDPKVSLSEVGKMAFSPYVRGRARELILKGKINNNVPRSLYVPVNSLSQSIIDKLQLEINQ